MQHFPGQERGLILLFFSAWCIAHTGSSLATGSFLVPSTVLYTLKDQEGNLFYGKKQKLGVIQTWIQILALLGDVS